MATVTSTLSLPAGLAGVTLTSWAGDATFSPAPVAGDYLAGPDTLSIGADGVVTGADGTYTLSLIKADGSAESVSYVIGVVADTTAPVITLTGGSVTLTVGDTFTDPGYSATDDTDGDLTGSVVVTGSVDTTTEGVYPLSYNVSDAAGNAAIEQTRTVTVEAASVPVEISVTTTLGVPAGHDYVIVGSDPDYTLFDENGYTTGERPQVGDVFIYATDSATVFYSDLTFDTDLTSGTLYFCIIRADGSADAAVMSNFGDVQVASADITDPVITLIGDNPLVLTEGDTFTDPGATATDDTDGSLSVTTSGTVDTATPGNYVITYTATDAAGNVGTATRTVTVEAAAPATTPLARPIVRPKVVDLTGMDNRVFLGRNNMMAMQMTMNGSVVPDDCITRAIIFMPGAASAGGDITFDTDSDSDIELTQNATVVVIKGGLRDIKPGRYRCLLTCFDSASPEGLAWDQISVTVREWPPTI